MEECQSIARSVRLTRIQHLLHSDHQGLTTSELANLCGVCIRTIQRDLTSLQSDLGIPLTQDGDRYGIEKGYILPPVSFSLYEAVALFLASRLVLRQADEDNPHVQTAITKLAGVLPAEMSAEIKKSMAELDKKPSAPGFMDVFEKVAIAWTTHRRLKISYLSLQSTEEKEWLLDPYFLDMTGVGYSTYVIGRGIRNERDAITTFKL
ncbi:MAG: hypothetical protein Q8P44_02790, partial [Dehalococcoidia bacterium]|nr:hypothetical protein [Dehalococcoidia bacterium]